jgi:hypothetical protein
LKRFSPRNQSRRGPLLTSLGLATLQDNGALTEFPVSTDASSAYIRMDYHGTHNHPLLNGHSSFVPPVYPEIARLLDEPVEVGRESVGIL